MTQPTARGDVARPVLGRRSRAARAVSASESVAAKSGRRRRGGHVERRAPEVDLVAPGAGCACHRRVTAATAARAPTLVERGRSSVRLTLPSTGPPGQCRQSTARMADTHTALDPGDVTVVAAMENEARPLRRLVPQLRLVRAGIGLARHGRAAAHRGGVQRGPGRRASTRELGPGTVVIPREVAREDGVMLACDVAWSAALERASMRLGFPTVTLPMLSAARAGDPRGRARRGSRRASPPSTWRPRCSPGWCRAWPRCGSILDNPAARDLTGVGEPAPRRRPTRATGARPHGWRGWVPRYTRRAALVVAAALAERRLLDVENDR